MPLDPQAALEQACVNAIKTSLSYAAKDCQRCFDGQPPPLCGPVFCSVWHDNSRTCNSRGDALDEQFGVYVTLTIRTVQPYDRLVQHRDDMERRMNAIRALIHKDSLNFSISNAAAVLADLDSGASRPIGFREGLAFERFDAIQLVGGSWFRADPSSTECGLAQTARFGKSRRVQRTATAT